MRMDGEGEAMEFRPELVSRRGEFTAWGLTLVVALGWAILLLSGRQVPRAVPFMAVFLLLSGLGISLSNWMDRQTVIRLDENSVTFDNGLRHTHLGMDEIRKILVTPSSWGKKVSVIGPQSHFEFRTLGEVRFAGEVKGSLGFRQGEQILSRLVSTSGLHPVERGLSGEYYARE